MNIVLINSGNDKGIGGNANENCYPPLGIISLATILKDTFQDKITLTLFDGQIDNIDTIIKSIVELHPDLVGVSMYCTSIYNTVRIIKEAKNCGAKTIIGNDHAISNYYLLLKQVKELDYVCLNEFGEFTITKLVEHLLFKNDITKVPLLAFRYDNKIVTNSQNIYYTNKYELDAIPIPDRSLLPSNYWELYLASFKNQQHKTINIKDATGVTTINRARGCSRYKKKCVYCSINDLTPRFSSGLYFWEDIRMATNQIKANYFYEVFDSATSSTRIIREWLNKKPHDLSHVRFKMYAQASETNVNSVKLFKDLGVYCVNIGFDSGDNKVLKILKGPANSESKNRLAAQLWTDAGIEIYASFVLMGLGNEYETKKSLDKTITFIQWLLESTSTISIDCALLYPDKSSIIGNSIRNPQINFPYTKELNFINFDKAEQFSNKWNNEIYIDPLELCNDFAEVCGISPKILHEYDDEIYKIVNKHKLNYGRSQGGLRI